MSRITFARSESDFRILNPFRGFSDEVHRVEVRKEPLLGDTSVYNPYLKDKVKAFFGENDQELVRKLVEDGAQNCIFCPEKVGTVTAKYPPDVLPEGRIIRGEATLFANVFSVGKYHPVVALSRAHFLKLSEFSPEIIANGFLAARDFLKIISRRDPSAPPCPLPSSRAPNPRASCSTVPPAAEFCMPSESHGIQSIPPVSLQHA